MIDNKKDNSDLTLSLRHLNKLAKQMKKRRNEAGSLTLASTQVYISFNKIKLNSLNLNLMTKQKIQKM